MFSIISIGLLIASINCIRCGVEWFRTLIIASAVFGIAGAIENISYKLGDLHSTNIKKKDQPDNNIKNN